MSTQKHPLPLRRLGRTELDVTCLSMGGAGIGGGKVTDDEAIEAVRRAITLGMNYLDTSPLYGESERRVGLALADGWREKIFLATKTGTHPQWRGDYSAAGTRRSVENSLRLLGTDYLDVCLVHDPSSMDPVVTKGGALDELQRMREEGLVKFIGLGVREHEFHKIAIETDIVDVILTHLDYTLLSQTANEWLLSFAYDNDIGVINGSPLGMALLTGLEPDVENNSPEAKKAHQLWQWATDNNLSLLNLAIQFSLRQPLIATTLTGSKNAIEVEQNFAAATTPVSDDVWKRLQTRL
ncbi:MAG: aldo/keto reductase [Candidatus Poribacteria bacterium]|nr:aldo/keto reductase [Candidatus Poribacteria bacterium]